MRCVLNRPALVFTSPRMTVAYGRGFGSAAPAPGAPPGAPVVGVWGRVVSGRAGPPVGAPAMLAPAAGLAGCGVVDGAGGCVQPASATSETAIEIRRTGGSRVEGWSGAGATRLVRRRGPL